eukprot:2247568-Rhodomonas_salina.1
MRRANAATMHASSNALFALPHPSSLFLRFFFLSGRSVTGLSLHLVESRRTSPCSAAPSTAWSVNHAKRAHPPEPTASMHTAGGANAAGETNLNCLGAEREGFKIESQDLHQLTSFCQVVYRLRPRVSRSRGPGSRVQSLGSRV